MEYLFVYLSDARSSVSQQDASDLSNRFRRTVSYIPNGVNAHLEIDLEGARALLTRHNITTGNFILFAAGRLIPLKGLEVLLHAWRGYPDNTNRLVILSDFTENNPYHRTIREMAYGRVHFLPLVTRPDQLNGMMQCAVFLSSHPFTRPCL
jgi:glycosyltransferase involved in cell wall biosynthesis